jgi:hypothetical protein
MRKSLVAPSVPTLAVIFSAHPGAFQVHLEDHEYSMNTTNIQQIFSTTKTAIRISSNSTATGICEHKYSLFVSGYSQIFMIFATRGILYPL